MRLIIHAGAHKTGTTTFQRLCYYNSETLIAGKVLYPKYKNWKQHSYLAWQFQRQNKQVISEFFQKVENDCKAFGCTTAIISGEDFENCLVDHAMAIELEKISKLAGFKEIEWIVVQRKPDQYLRSIYGELSKQQIYGEVVLNVEVMARCIKRNGYFSFASKYYNYKFIFDFQKFIPNFASKVNSNITLIDFEDFKKNFVGNIIFNKCLDQSFLINIEAQAEKQKPQNVSDNLQTVENRYAMNYFHVKDSSGLETNFRNLIIKVASIRAQRSAKFLDNFAKNNLNKNL